MRRLPVYLLLDTSGSMSGEPIEALRNGVQLLVSTLRQSPQAIETAHICVITFNSSAKVLIPITDLFSFKMQDIQASGTTSLGDALRVLSHCIEKDVVKTTKETKGDWKPIVFILTDGIPTDDWKNGLDSLRKQKTGLVVACAAGSHADTSILKQITNDVIQLDTADSLSLNLFFQWLTASINSSSTTVGESGNEVTSLNDLPSPPTELNIVI
jgi:uncharacterized protein YegL